MEESFFSDESIIEQSSAMIQTKRGVTNGISLVVDFDSYSCGEILLPYEELVKAVADLEKDREAFPYDY